MAERIVSRNDSIRSDYLRTIFDPQTFPKVINRICRKLREFDKQFPFDSIAFRGASGTLVAPIVAMRLKKNLLMVRKSKNAISSHSTLNIEGNVQSNNYLIIDDLICSGDTIRAIIDELKSSPHYGYAKPVGIFLYTDQSSGFRYYGKLTDNVPIATLHNDYIYIPEPEEENSLQNSVIST